MLRSGIVVAFYTFLSRALGLVRELFVADLFGCGPIADSVNVALKLPNLFRRIFGEGALSSVFVPIFSKKLVAAKDDAEIFATKIFWLLVFALSIITLLLEYFMPEVMIVIAPGFHLDPEKFELSVLLCRITSPYLILICVSALLGGMLNSAYNFAAFAFVPVILNIAIIGGTILLGKYIDSSVALAYSVSIGGILQLIFMFISLRFTNLHLRKLNKDACKDEDVSKLLRAMGPASISSGAAQLNIFISQSIASFIPGAVSVLSYAERLYQFPLSIIGTAFSTVLLPNLSKLRKIGDIKEIDKMQNNATKFALFLSVPASCGMIVLSEPIIRLIYQHGAFLASDTAKTAVALACFSLGLPAFILAKIFTPIFYANHDTKTPMNITLISLCANVVLNVILMQFISTSGIALGSSIAAWYNLHLLFKAAKKANLFNLENETVKFTVGVIFSSIILSAVAHVVRWLMCEFCGDASLLEQSINLVITIAVAMISYIASSIIFGIITIDQLNYKRYKK